MHATLPLLARTDFPALRRRAVETLQVNLGYRCNQSCLHCHVAAGPNRTEEMSHEDIEAVVAFLAAHPGVRTLDLTGGAPELNPHFRSLVTVARGLGVHVIDRCNLTILEEPGQEGLDEFLAAQGVEVVASMPCYLEGNVDRQRGKGTFDASIRGLRRLNALGYARPGTGLALNLVYNPQGPSLPPPQEALEADYRSHLADEHGVAFDRLYTLANMPIQRFGSMLVSKGTFHDYMALLRGAHREANLDQVMCRSLLSVDWQGHVYDCDFNQQLGLPIRDGGRARVHLRDLAAGALAGRPIRVADHCFGCTAGQGSSCGGALEAEAGDGRRALTRGRRSDDDHRGSGSGDGMSGWQGVFFWGFLIAFGVVMYALAPRSKDEAGFFRGHDERGRPASQWALASSIFISWIFAKSVTNAANLGAAYGVVGGLAYAAYWLSIPLAGFVIHRLRTREGATGLVPFLIGKYGRGAALAFSAAILVRLFNEVWSNTAVVGGYYGPAGSGGFVGAALLFTAAVLFYSLKGGLRSSIFSDVIQAVVFVLFLGVVLAWVLPAHAPAALLSRRHLRPRLGRRPAARRAAAGAVVPVPRPGAHRPRLHHAARRRCSGLSSPPACSASSPSSPSAWSACTPGSKASRRRATCRPRSPAAWARRASSP